MNLSASGIYNFSKRLLGHMKQGELVTAARLAYEMGLRGVYNVFPKDGVDVADEEWDVLIVLTACRYDTFREVNRIGGELLSKRSKGSSLMDWLVSNFDGGHDDIVYVSGNPRISNVEFKQLVGTFQGEDHFHEVVDVSHANWDAERNTVPPEAVTEAAIDAAAEYPDKRLVVHYLQPHAPWIGDTAITGADLGISYDSPSEWFANSGELGPWGEFGVAMDDYSTEHVKQAYRDNVRLVLGEVERLVDDLDGRIVVTADHGEAFGEKFIIEHPPEIYIEELVRVPWFVVDKSTEASEKRL